MKALDTNIVVRFLVRDDERQAQAVRKTMLHAEAKGERLFVGLPVILETIWVLSAVYGYSQEETTRGIEGLLVLSVLEIEEHERVAELCRVSPNQKLELADLLIGLTSRDRGCESTLTFDKKAAQSALFSMVE